MSAITPRQAREFLDRWKEVERMQRALERATPMEMRLRQLAALVAARAVFGADPERDREVEQVRERWQRIRTALGG